MINSGQMHPDLATTLHLQELDLRIASLRHEIASLPRQVAEIERELEGHLKRLDLDKTKLTANQRERKRLEGEIQMQQQRISKLRDQTMQAKTNEQFRAFQNEIEFCEKEIRKFEDSILELMSASEALETNVKAAEKSLTAQKTVVEGKKSEAKAQTDANQAELKTLVAERKTAAERLPASLLSTYERLRTRNRDGIAIAEAKDGRCLACNMMLRPQFFQELKTGEQVMGCENCKRLLYVQPPAVDVAAEMQL